MARLAVLAGALALTGCNTEGDAAGATVSRLIVGEYVGVEPVELRLGAEVFRIFDNRAIKKMIVTRPFGWTLVYGAGWTPKEPYEAAAMQHLANTGRGSCRLTAFSAIMGPKHEAKYECALSANAVKPAR